MRTKMVLQGVVVEHRTPYGDGVVDVRNVIERYGEKAIVLLAVAACLLVRRDA